MNRGNCNLVAIFLLMIACFCGAILTSGYVLADGDSVVDQINITVAESCTLAGVGMDSHVATLHNAEYSGQSGSDYVNGIGKTTLTAFCNDYNGFSIYAIGFTGDSYTSTNHTKLVGANDNTNTISTGVYSSGDTTSSWAMKITKVTDGAVAYNPVNMSVQNSFDNWHVVPDTYTKVAEYHANSGSSATDTVLGGKLETTYQAYVSASQAADTYEGQVKYTLVHPYDEEPLQPQTAEAGCIRYYPNGNGVEGTMGCQSISASDTSVTLLASNFSRQGYGFAGWSDAFDYDTNANAHFYGPQEDITFTAGQYTGTNPGLSLYAVWVESAGNLQDSSIVTQLCGTSPNTGTLITAPTNGTASLSSVSALTDQRDNETYAIARLADGNCWMIENLRLENTGTDNTNGTLAQGYNKYSFAGLADPEEPSLFASVTTANTLYSTDGSTIKTISGTYQGSKFPRYNNVNTPSTVADRPTDPTTNSATNNTTNAGMYSYGNYYTWAAAIADTFGYSSGNINTTSICPTGWRIPTGNTSGEYYTLNTAANFGAADPNGSGRLRAYPNNFVYSGDIQEGSVGARGSHGFYWSSTPNATTSAYVLYFYSSYVDPGTYRGAKYCGKSIRCLALGT